MNRKLSDYVDKVYIINLLSRPDRRHFMVEQLKAIGIYDDLVSTNKLEIVDAVKLPGFNKAVLDTFNAENGGSIGTTGLYFCATEHYRVLKRALYYGYEKILVLEDDACFYKDIERLYDALDSAPKSFDILHLEGYYFPDENHPTESDWMAVLSDNIDEAYWHSNEGFRLWAAAALVYSRSGMEEIVKEQERIFCGSDTPTFFADAHSYFYTLSDITVYAKGADLTNVYARKANKEDYYKITDF